MFVCAVHGNTVKFFGIIGVAVMTLVLLIVLIPNDNVSSEKDVSGYTVKSDYGNSIDGAYFSESDVSDVLSIKFDKVKTNEERISLLKSFGWEVEETPVEEADVTIPAEFDRVFENYNAIQKSQGFDLSKYKNRSMKRFTYRVTNYPDYEGTVYCNLLIYKNRVVGADICSSDVNGFIRGLK